MNYIQQKTRMVMERGARDRAARRSGRNAAGGLGVIPLTAWILAFIVSAGLALLAFLVLIPGDPTMRHWHGWQRSLFTLGVAVFVAIYTLLIGFIYGDAKRRRMRHVMWTLLAIFVPNAIGIVLYFLLRDPLPAPCAACGKMADGTFSFCPHCGAGLAYTCPQCHHAVEAGWGNCAYCGEKLGGQAPSTA